MSNRKKRSPQAIIASLNEHIISCEKELDDTLYRTSTELFALNNTPSAPQRILSPEVKAMLVAWIENNISESQGFVNQDHWERRESNPYPFCKLCNRTNVQVSFKGHHVTCALGKHEQIIIELAEWLEDIRCLALLGS